MPDGATVIFSAHGVSRAVEEKARQRGFTVFDATCPLVTKVHMEVARYAREAREVVLIGHAGHPEVEGTMGRFDPRFGGHIHLVENVEDVAQLEVGQPDALAFVTQTTLSVDDTVAIVEALRRASRALQAPRKEDICYATQNRQDAVKRSARGLRRAGGRRLADQLQLQPPARARPSAPGCRRIWSMARRICSASGSTDRKAVGVTAGASAPELLVGQVVAQLRDWGGTAPEEVSGRAESVVFSLPRSLRAAKRG